MHAWIVKRPVITGSDVTRDNVCKYYSPGEVRGVVVSTLANHASGPGSIPVAGGKKERLISLLLNIRGCAPRGSHIT